MRFSQINLPGSNLLVKSNLNLHFINYWQLLKQKTTVSNVDINSLDDMIQYEDDNFVDSIKNYVLDFSENDRPYGLSDVDVYNEFLKIVIPKTRVLFNLVKKYIKGKLSMVDLINYLEPFLIYAKDISNDQFIKINDHIELKMKLYVANYDYRYNLFKLLNRFILNINQREPISIFNLLNSNFKKGNAKINFYFLGTELEEIYPYENGLIFF